ncbi:uncharacterized protein J4E87_000672 [Alternaria ethzedia]|uniref:uncharacterized protein n=1 Tax=Alternaria ethzedia TaxID=181014 RepID=UPI0020C49C3C|nr:uncharacterized protein J4E87_000672 [Alternaria ethzedia]KAI4635717.1 hypothetical protein J4E87_000672 [Alternaria ethzedia]
MVHFRDPSALARSQGKHRPDKLYRHHFENAATLSLYVNKINHISHKEVPDLKLQDGNAFQSVGTLKPTKDITKERIHRHYKTQQKRRPSAYVSAMPSMKDAEEKMRNMHKTRITAPRRMFLAEIDVSDMVAGILKTKMATTSGEHTTDDRKPLTLSTTDSWVEIPIWIQDAVPYEGSPAIRPPRSVESILNSGGQIWLSVNELTKSDLRVWAMQSHENEWLALSNIPETSILNVLPFDGAVLHTGKGYELVRNRRTDGGDIYLWNFDTNMWVHDPDLTDPSPYRDSRIGEKRKADGDVDVDSNSDDQRTPTPDSD